MSTAASYGSARVRGRTRLVWLDAPGASLLARVGALVVVSAAFQLWHTIEPGPAAGFVVMVGLMVDGALVASLVRSRRAAGGPWRVSRCSVFAVLREVLPWAADAISDTTRGVAAAGLTYGVP